jgi:hypothetical protein
MIRPRTWLFLVLNAALLSAAATSDNLQSEGALDTKVRQAILEQLDRQQEKTRLQFSVPVDVIRECQRIQETKARPLEADAPVSGLLGKWDAVVIPHKDRVEIKLVMTATLFRATPATPFQLPLFPVDEVFNDLTLNGESANPTEHDGWWTLALDKPGPALITATLTRRASRSNGTLTVRLAKQSFPAATVSIQSDALIDLSANTGGNTFTATMGGKSNRDPIPIGTDEHVTLSIHPHRERTVQRGTPSLNPSFVWTVGEQVLTANGLIDISILGGSRDKVSLMLPQGADNLDVSGLEVRETRHTGSRVEVCFKHTISSRTTVRLSFELPRKSMQTFSCPEISVEEGRTGNAGWLLIVNDAGGEILEHTVQGLKPTSMLNLPDGVAGLSPGKPTFIYRRTAPRVTAQFETATTLPFPMRDTIADRADVVATLRPAGDEIVRIRYTIRNNRQQFLRVCPPPGSHILAASVEGRECQISCDGKDWLIPLAKSIQTLGGLVSFPVELTYVRKGKPLNSRQERTCKLPRLSDVPVALINVTWNCPGGIRLQSYDSALLMDQDRNAPGQTEMTYGYGHERLNTSESRDTIAGHSLAGNYYRAGYTAYKQGRLEDAEHYLGSAVTFVDDAEMSKNARDLLSNIWVGRGDVDGSLDASGRAKVAAIQRGLEGDNIKLATGQQRMIQSGLDLIQQGDAELGVELLAEAEAQGGQLQQRNASKHELEAVSVQYAGKLREVREQQQENKDLHERLSQLQLTTHALTAREEKQTQQTAYFSQALAQVAGEENLDLETLQEAAFGLNVKDLARDTSQNIDKKIQAKRAAQTHGQAKAKRSLSARNRRLTKQVDALERVIEASNRMPEDRTQPIKPQLSGSQYASIRRQVAEVRKKAKGIKWEIAAPAAYNPSHVAELVDEQSARKQLGELQAWVGANSLAFANVDHTLQAEFQQLETEISEGEAIVSQAHAAQQQAQTITVNLDDVLGDRPSAEKRAFGVFLTENYIGALTNTVGTIAVDGDQIYADNAWDNASILNDAVSNFSKNDGMVARVKGRAVKGHVLDGIPQLGKRFQTRTKEGQHYAVLDEAEYQTLLDAERRASGKQGDFAATATERDVIVGSANSTAGQAFTLATGGEHYNGLIVNGSTIDLPHNRYLAIDNGDFVTVLHSNRIRDWQDVAEAPTSLIPTASQTIEIPQIGKPLHFKKTYLEAGESPDVVLHYTYKGDTT